MRTLRSKKLRAALYAKAGGKCQSCGCELSSDWHADHIIPWSVTKRTNVHEMQALCPACNLKKGNRMADRRHQAEAKQIADNIIGGVEKPSVIADVTPGGGKSRLICGFARKLLQANFIHHVVWGCPRSPLCDQAKDSWAEAGLPESDLTVEHYANIHGNALELQQLCDSRRVLFVADELQFLKDYGDGQWSRSASRLFEQSSQFLGVSGTLFSSSAGRLLGVKYKEGSLLSGGDYRSGTYYPIPDIQYNLRDALEDGSVIQYDIRQTNALATTELGASYSLMDPESTKYNGLLKPLLEKQSVWEPIVDQCVREWLEYREHAYKSIAIFVASGIDHARRIQKWLIKRGISTALALSDEPSAKAQIEMLKSRKFDTRPRALVTVAMASIGLDIPSVSHLCYLNHYRFFGFLLQCWARASRVCYEAGISVDHQRAFIYTVRDPRMDKFVEWIRSQSPKGFREMEGGEQPPPPVEQQVLADARVDKENNFFCSSDPEPGIGGAHGDELATAIERVPVLSMVPKKAALQLLPALNLDAFPASKERVPDWSSIQGTPAMKKKALRKALDIICRRVASETGSEHNRVRVSAQTFDGVYMKLDDLPHPEGVIEAITNAFAILMSVDPDCTCVGLNYQVPGDLSQEEKTALHDRHSDMAQTISDIYAEFGISLSCVARARRGK